MTAAKPTPATVPPRTFLKRLVGAVVLALANWVYLIADGR